MKTKKNRKLNSHRNHFSWLFEFSCLWLIFNCLKAFSISIRLFLFVNSALNWFSDAFNSLRRFASVLSARHMVAAFCSSWAIFLSRLFDCSIYLSSGMIYIRIVRIDYFGMPVNSMGSNILTIHCQKCSAALLTFQVLEMLWKLCSAHTHTIFVPKVTWNPYQFADCKYGCFTDSRVGFNSIRSTQQLTYHCVCDAIQILNQLSSTLPLSFNCSQCFQVVLRWNRMLFVCSAMLRNCLEIFVLNLLRVIQLMSTR